MRVIDTDETKTESPAAGAEGTPLYIPLQGDQIPTLNALKKKTGPRG